MRARHSVAVICVDGPPARRSSASAADQENRSTPAPSPVRGSKYSRKPLRSTSSIVTLASASACPPNPYRFKPSMTSQLMFSQVGPCQYRLGSNQRELGGTLGRG